MTLHLREFETYFDKHKPIFNMAENNTPPNDVNNPHDKFFKAAMGMKSIATAFTRQFLPKNILDKLNLDTLELDTASYITDDLKENFADLVWRCNFKNGGRQARIAFLHEHKSYLVEYPHFQLLDYIRGAWTTQIKQDKLPYLTIPIVLYHGKEKWEEAPLDSYFGVVEPDMLRFIPCFDYVLVNLQKYSDETIRAIDSIFLYRTLLAFKHSWDKTYLKLYYIDLLLERIAYEKNDEKLSFLIMICVYLSNVSDITKAEIMENVNKSDHNLNPQSMSVFEEIIEEFREKGIEKGIEKEKRETIIRSWKNGIETSMIANITGVSIAEIEKVIADFQSNA